MKFVAMEEIVHFDEEDHFLDDYAEWVECSAKSFAEARDTFREIERRDSGPHISADIGGFPIAVYEDEPFFRDELSERLGVPIEWDTDLDELIAALTQTKALI